MAKVSDINWAPFIGRDLGNVTIVRELGRGATGVVFIGYQKSLKRQVAIKILHKDVAQSDKAQSLFREEGEIVAILSHPNIIPIFEMNEEPDCFYQVMQLIEGTDLRLLLSRRLKNPIPSKRILPFEQTIDYLTAILDGLSYAHEEGIVHQDIKPGNILIEERHKRPLIADFGIARVAATESESKQLIVGTPLYMAPEQAACQPTDGRADIYSVGVMLFEMCAGTLPVRVEPVVKMLSRKKDDPGSFFVSRPAQVSQTINLTLEAIITKAIAPNTQNRYASCQTFKEELFRYKDRYCKHNATPADTIL